jgi:regulator of protease activity HflC (stomatin/prohibitin superfamily)
MEHLITLLLGSVSGLGALFSSFRFVKEGELGSMTTFGKTKRDSQNKIKIIKPGLILMIPIVNAMQKAHIKRDSIQLEDLNVTLKSGLSCHFSAFVSYHVADDADGLEKFLYLVEEPRELISQKLASSIREVLQQKESVSEITGDQIISALTDELKKYLEDNIGVKLDSCGLTSLTESVQSQAVTVTKAKVAYATELYGGLAKIPVGVMEASFGSQPVTLSSTTFHEHHHNDELGPDGEKKETKN